MRKRIADLLHWLECKAAMRKRRKEALRRRRSRI